MKTKISYLEFARPFKYNKDFFVLPDVGAEIAVIDNSRNSEKEKVSKRSYTLQ